MKGRIPMQFLSFESVQDPTFQHEEDLGGAYINCWIKNQTSKNAAHIAEGWIQESGWVITKTVAHRVLVGEDRGDDERSEQYFDQALTDEEVFVFHTFPMNEKDEPSEGARSS